MCLSPKIPIHLVCGHHVKFSSIYEMFWVFWVRFSSHITPFMFYFWIRTHFNWKRGIGCSKANIKAFTNISYTSIQNNVCFQSFWRVFLLRCSLMKFSIRLWKQIYLPYNYRFFSIRCIESLRIVLTWLFTNGNEGFCF